MNRISSFYEPTLELADLTEMSRQWEAVGYAKGQAEAKAEGRCAAFVVGLAVGCLVCFLVWVRVG